MKTPLMARLLSVSHHFSQHRRPFSPVRPPPLVPAASFVSLSTTASPIHRCSPSPRQPSPLPPCIHTYTHPSPSAVEATNITPSLGPHTTRRPGHTFEHATIEDLLLNSAKPPLMDPSSTASAGPSRVTRQGTEADRLAATQRKNASGALGASRLVQGLTHH